jgi:hypothetical protein
MMPDHQFPTGVAFSAARRTAVLGWAHRQGGLVMEDDFAAEFRSDRRPLSAIAGLDPDRVTLLGSVRLVRFSSAFSLGAVSVPGARLKRRRVVIAAIVAVVAVSSTVAAASVAVMTSSRGAAPSPTTHVAPTEMAVTARDDIQNPPPQAAGLVYMGILLRPRNTPTLAGWWSPGGKISEVRRSRTSRLRAAPSSSTSTRSSTTRTAATTTFSTTRPSVDRRRLAGRATIRRTREAT